MVKRLQEPSTWAGLAVLMETLKLLVPQYAALIVGLQAVAGGVAVVMRERGAAGNGGGSVADAP